MASKLQKMKMYHYEFGGEEEAWSKEITDMKDHSPFQAEVRIYENPYDDGYIMTVEWDVPDELKG